MRFIVPLAVGGLCITLAGCGGSDVSGWAGSVTDSAGVTIVSNPNEGIWSASARWALEEELRIGTAGGDPDYQFGQILGIVVAEGGRVAVLDQQASEIRVFSPEGVLEHTFGRAGNGPGELTVGAGPLLSGAGDTLFVPDIGNQRVNRYTTDGTSAGSFPLRIEDGLPMKWEGTSTGLLANQVRPFPLPDRPLVDSMDVVILRNSDGEAVDTLLMVPSGKTISLGGGAPEFNFFVAEPTWTLTPDRQVWYALNDDYRIGLYGQDGSLERVVQKPFDRPPVTEQDQDVFRKFFERAWTDAGVPPAALAQLRQGIHFAEFFPAFAQFMSGPNRTLWVQHLKTPSDLTPAEQENFNPLLALGAAQWDVFDADGRFLGVIDMPERFQPVRFAGEQIYGIWQDDLDVQYVMRLRVTGIVDGDTDRMPVGVEGGK